MKPGSVSAPGSVPLALVAVVGLLGFLLVAAAGSARDTDRAEAPRRAALVKEIGNRRSQAADLEQAARELQSQLDAVEGAAARQDDASRTDAARIAALQEQAGATSLTGPGVVVRLSDSSRIDPDPHSAAALQIHDTDLRLVVNALLSAGAEAVAVNDARISATTAIRQAGTTIVVNFRPLVPPYKVVAIGADLDAFEGSDVARRFHRYVSQLGLGFSVSRATRVEIPGFVGRLGVDDATPVEPPARKPVGEPVTTIPNKGKER